jgi:hypothetical protein
LHIFPGKNVYKDHFNTYNTVIKAPIDTPPMTLTRPVNTAKETLRASGAPMAAFLEVKEAAAAVATVYSEPAKEVTAPAPLVARVTAWPPADVITVATEPPMARRTLIIEYEKSSLVTHMSQW